MYGAKWRNFKLVLIAQKYMTDAPAKLSIPRLINLTIDPQEREVASLPYLHSWTVAHFNRLIADFSASVAREPVITAGAPLDHQPMGRGCLKVRLGSEAPVRSHPKRGTLQSCHRTLLGASVYGVNFRVSGTCGKFRFGAVGWTRARRLDLFTSDRSFKNACAMSSPTADFGRRSNFG